jgi:kumamolisin
LLNRSDLEARVNAGQMFTRTALDAYLPRAEDYAKVRSWLVSQGFEITLDANARHAIFARGSVSKVAEAFGVGFARVATVDGEFSSIVSPPSIPDDLAPIVSSVKGLQPQLIRHPHSQMAQQLQATDYLAITPAALATLYQAPTPLTGAGETIAIIGDAFPSPSDLDLFWAQCGISDTPNSVSLINVGAGPGSNTTNQFELSMDTEWSSGLAPAAQLRVYAAAWPLNSAAEAEAYTQILNDLPSYPGLHQVSESYGGGESIYDDDSSILLLIAQGVTCFASSGDGGSNPSGTDAYSPTAGLSVQYPASDPSVTGVGGTTAIFPVIDAGISLPPETAWTPIPSEENGTGGGISVVFARPSWQTGIGVPAGTMRCVPDVSAMANYGASDMGALVFQGGNAYVGSGTSLASPVWAGLCALMNQSRAANGLAPIGFLNPKIYASGNSACFTDITGGNNGAYYAGVGYDLCTGLGTPLIGNLISYLNTVNQSPWIYQSPTDETVWSKGPAQFSVVAGGYPSPAIQWQVSNNGGGSWSNLTDSGTYSGSQTAELRVTNSQASMEGFEYRAVSKNSQGTVASGASLLTVTPPGSDFNGDGHTDILWQNSSTGERGTWLMNGTTYLSWYSFGNISTDWQVMGTADFLGNGNSDILWENSATGECGIWMMNGTTFSSWVSYGDIAVGWHIAGTGDFNRDGHTDILWQNTITGERGIWLMNGTTFSSWVSLGVVSTDWQIVGTGDFDGDGQVDILWQNGSTGERGVWLMNGDAFKGWVSFGDVSTSWQIMGTGEFDSTGNADILWQNTATGECGVWLMSGTTYSGWVSFGIGSLQWQIRNK